MTSWILGGIAYLTVALLVGMRHYQAQRLRRGGRHDNMADLEAMVLGAFWPGVLAFLLAKGVFGLFAAVSRIGLTKD